MYLYMYMYIIICIYVHAEIGTLPETFMYYMAAVLLWYLIRYHQVLEHTELDMPLY